MSHMFRFVLALIILLSGALMPFDGADAKRKFRSSSSSDRDYSGTSISSSRTYIVPTPRYHGGASTISGNKPVDSNGIELVYNMPNTQDYAYGSGFFDVGFRHMADNTGDYVIYAGPHFMALKPKLQGQIAERLGFDPVEEHKKRRAQYGENVEGVTTQSSLANLSAPHTDTEEVQEGFFSKGWAYGIAILLFGMGGIIIYAYQRRVKSALQTDGCTNLEERMNARLRSMRE